MLPLWKKDYVKHDGSKERSKHSPWNKKPAPDRNLSSQYSSDGSENEEAEEEMSDMHSARDFKTPKKPQAVEEEWNIEELL